MNLLTAIDFYKADHHRQYPEGTTEIYSNFTARSAKNALSVIPDFNGKILFVGLQFFIEYFLESFKESLMDKENLSEYERIMENSLGGSFCMGHLCWLRKFVIENDFLPLHIKSIPEGSLVPIGVPVLTIRNTHPDFFWLTNYIETALSSYLWRIITSATISFEYRRIFEKYAKETGAKKEFIKFQGHDFSFRGMPGIEAAVMSGIGHLSCFYGTDTVPAIQVIKSVYDEKNDPIGFSVPATEHSVMCMDGQDGEFQTFKRLITELYPKGIVSIVSDTWDFWRVIIEYLPLLKNIILNRDGKVVIRPDSGCPIDILTGDDFSPEGTPERKGAVQCLWELFGGEINDKGYKTLDGHIGLIYGDSITLYRSEKILCRLKEKGFSSDNIIFGIGSYTYQNVTRDTFGFAMKSTSGVVNGERREIYKDPKTDSGLKKSARGLLRVYTDGGEYCVAQQQSETEEMEGSLRTVYFNGRKLLTSFNAIRKQIDYYFEE